MTRSTLKRGALVRRPTIRVAACAAALCAALATTACTGLATLGPRSEQASAQLPTAAAERGLAVFVRKRVAPDYPDWSVKDVREVASSSQGRIRVVTLARTVPDATVQVTYRPGKRSGWESTDDVLRPSGTWASRGPALLAALRDADRAGRGVRIAFTRAPRAGRPLEVDVALSASGGRETTMTLAWDSASKAWVGDLAQAARLPEVGPRISGPLRRAVTKLMRAEYPGWKVLSVRRPAPNATDAGTLTVTLENAAEHLLVRVPVCSAKGGVWRCGDPVLAESGCLHRGAAAFLKLLAARRAGASDSPVWIGSGNAGAVHVTYETTSTVQQAWLAYDRPSRTWVELSAR